MGNSNETYNKKSTAEQVSKDVDLSGKVCVITGSSSGLGEETARVLALRGARIIMACRNMEKAEKVRARILAFLKKTNKEYSDDLITVLQLDLSSLLSVRQFVNSFTKLNEQINYLVCNAGIMFLPDFTPSVDGYEMQFATNHLGHFYLTHLLTPILLKSDDVRRVIVLSSSYHTSAPKLIGPSNFILDGIKNKSGPSSKKAYSMKGNKEYGLSKICNALFAMEYYRRYKDQGIVSVSVHPGVINTDLGRHAGFGGAVFYTLGSVFMKSIPQGAATTVRCVTMDDKEIQGGHYYRDCQEGNAALRKDIRPAMPKKAPPKKEAKVEKKEEKAQTKDESDDKDKKQEKDDAANVTDEIVDKPEEPAKDEPAKDEPANDEPKDEPPKDESQANDDEATKEKEKESDDKKDDNADNADKEQENPKENDENEEVKKDDSQKDETKEEVKEEKVDEAELKQKRIEASYGYKLWEWSELLITEKGFALDMDNFEEEEKLRIEEEERLKKEKQELEEKEAEEARLKQEELEQKQKEEAEKKAKENEENKENKENDDNKVSDKKENDDKVNDEESKPNENDAPAEPVKEAEKEPEQEPEKESEKQDEPQQDDANKEEPADPVSQ